MGCGESKEGAYRGLTDDQISTLHDVQRTFASLSFVGSLTIIFCYIRCRDLRKFAFKLVFLISVSDCLSAIGDFITPPEDQCGPCMLQSYLVSIFNLSSVLWTACIGHCLYRAVRHHELDVEKYEIRYHIFAWGVPLLLALIPSNNMYGYDNGACWILERYAWMRFVQFYIPLLLTIAYNGVVYARIIASLRAVLRSQDSAQREQDLETFWRMGLYPAVLVVCWFFGIVNRLQNSISPDHPSFELYLLHRLFGSCQGLLNCLVYGMNRSVRQKLPEVLCCRGAGEGEGEGEGIQMSAARAETKPQPPRSDSSEHEDPAPHPDPHPQPPQGSPSAATAPAHAPRSDQV